MSNSHPSQCSPLKNSPFRLARPKVRPVLRRILAAELLAVGALLALDTPHALQLRRWVAEFSLTLGQIQAVLTVLAALAVVAVMVEGVRLSRVRRRDLHRSRLAAPTALDAQLV